MFTRSGQPRAWHRHSGALGDLARLHAARADPKPLGDAPDDGPDRDEVRQPPALGDVVRVADSAADGGVLPADGAALGHDGAPLSSCWARSSLIASAPERGKPVARP